jgi:hypothetical protein
MTVQVGGHVAAVGSEVEAAAGGHRAADGAWSDGAARMGCRRQVWRPWHGGATCGWLGSATGCGGSGGCGGDGDDSDLGRRMVEPVVAGSVGRSWLKVECGGASPQLRSTVS